MSKRHTPSALSKSRTGQYADSPARHAPKSTRLTIAAAIAALPFGLIQADAVSAQELQSFAIVSGATLTNTGSTIIDGNIALSPGTSYTGRGSVSQTGSVFIADATARRMQDRLTTLYNALTSRQATQNLTGQDLAGMTLTPGVYSFDSSAGISTGGVLTLDAGGDAGAVFIFNINSTFIAEHGASVLLQGEAQGGNVFYRVGTSATLHTTSSLVGQIVALASITMNNSAAIDCGSAYARTGSVTLDTNTINVCTLIAQSFDDALVDPSLNESQRRIARSLSDYVASGGVLPIEFAILAATQSPEELAASLSQLSGEVSTGVAPMVMQSMDAFLDTVMGAPRPTRAIVASDSTPAGMVLDRAYEDYTTKYGLAGTISDAPVLSFMSPAALQPRPWNIWVSGYGSNTTTSGDADLGVHERTSTNAGIAAGLNYAINDNTDVGFALSWNKADFDLANAFGSGNSETLLAALRARTISERGYIEGALAYGKSDITTDRTLTIAGIDRLAGETKGEMMAAHVEAGYHMGIFTPFAGLRAKSFTADAYSETAALGTTSYALHHDKHTTTSLRSELGVAMTWSADDSASGSPSFGLRAAWAYELASNDPGRASFLSAPGVTMQVSGTERDKNSLLLAASAGWAASNGVFLDAGLNAEYSSNSQNYGGSLTVGYRW